MSDQAVVRACEQEWDAYKSDCSGFLRAVAGRVGIPVPTLDANGIVGWLEGDASGFERLDDGSAARDAAVGGRFVIGGLKGPDHNPPRAHGHVVIVVGGDLAHGRYPAAYWGSLGAVGRKAATVNYAWTSADRDAVEYYARSL